ncbi:MAG: hypothetical protein MJE77_44950 [Proteobacteria bacterium]|nr:hypothetical protein [Pseudomonadota bacterium]
MTQPQLHSRLSTLLERGPSESVWQHIVAVFDTVRDTGVEKEIVRFLEPRLDRWPDGLRRAPGHWWAALQDGESPRPAWSLVRSLVVPNPHDDLLCPDILAAITDLALHPSTTEHDWTIVSQLVGLQSLRASRVASLTDCEPLVKLTRLGWLDLKNCPELRDVTGLGGLGALRFLNLSGCYRVPSLTGLEHLPVEKLIVTGCDGVADFAPLASLEQLGHLEVGGENLISLDVLGDRPGLAQLKIAGCPGLTDLTALAPRPGLIELNLSACKALENLSALSGLPDLTRLTLHDLARVDDLSGLTGLTELTVLSLSNLPRCQALCVPRRAVHLEQLRLTRLARLTDLSALSALPALRQVTLAFCTSVANLDPLARLDGLEVLDLRGNRQLDDISPLLGLPRLRAVNLHGCTGIRNADLLAQKPGVTLTR